ncbi:TIGR03571 family LLM class oxidoreductase [Testudinibacter sp. TR-2022]|uniref:TIGR03571 family LLM class oxidoreductase n=1 Tax=Testudinibacter sp. TR-2022 TaxID=2585029 RepID=UPI001118F9FE|nr:TIGR03571 family LLM class oxidoreductase [Testudinibacter sp. TR-2022]TNH04372.1 TIGR03571 family LLM class oxidoreductase [Pasteurellaceae bacterium Phil11]TNH23167.1 TIGR03571 family LLM class oxidoreductase [Testudinibacter sp. TR-2022]TNH23657.1 TIGR03571 family LLM class oxidoreductase [Testudinibacter sp. TR-2022]
MNTPNLSILGQDNSHLFHPNHNVDTHTSLPPELARHQAMSRVFEQGKLTFGLIAPFKGYPNTAKPDIADMGDLAALAEKSGFAALWLRDVPFYDPNFGDVGQGLDPWVSLGYLAARTRTIALGTAGIVSPLRNPYHTAKAAASMDALSGGRFILGLSSGDRPVEYPIFAQDFANRAERFRDEWRIIRTLTAPKTHDFPVIDSPFYGTMSGNVDVYPKTPHRLPMVAIGRARQELDWLANESDGWIWHGVNPKDTGNIVQTLAELNQDGYWRPFGYANFVDLSDKPNDEAKLHHNIFLSGGSNRLLEFWQAQKEQGLAHITINLKPSRRPAEEVLQELGENVIAKL